MRVHDTGGPDSMRWESVDIAAPGPGEVHIRHTAIGLNYIDVYFRTGLYPAPAMPLTPGMEGAGEVVGVGAGVADLVVGDRVDGEIRAARELGCWAVRVARGEGQWAQSPSPIHQPHYTVPDVTALPAVLEDIQLGDESP